MSVPPQRHHPRRAGQQRASSTATPKRPNVWERPADQSRARGMGHPFIDRKEELFLVALPGARVKERGLGTPGPRAVDVRQAMGRRPAPVPGFAPPPRKGDQEEAFDDRVVVYSKAKLKEAEMEELLKMKKVERRKAEARMIEKHRTLRALIGSLQPTAIDPPSAMPWKKARDHSKLLKQARPEKTGMEAPDICGGVGRGCKAMILDVAVKGDPGAMVAQLGQSGEVVAAGKLLVAGDGQVAVLPMQGEFVKGLEVQVSGSSAGAVVEAVQKPRECGVILPSSRQTLRYCSSCLAAESQRAQTLTMLLAKIADQEAALHRQVDKLHFDTKDALSVGEKLNAALQPQVLEAQERDREALLDAMAQASLQEVELRELRQAEAAAKKRREREKKEVQDRIDDLEDELEQVEAKFKKLSAEQERLRQVLSELMNVPKLCK
mmetsp:Transcript_9220/g.22946  ORF Transcript_9220/g.22946 Transcript_9220/m.22946 type:complete len:436 (+) Transcript_9220:32-1339(+)